MKKAQHTPGPWIGKTARTIHHIHSASGHLVASLAYSSDQERADARLIDAAPELLEALETLADWNWKNKGKCPLELLEQARAAIAKAKGE